MQDVTTSEDVLKFIQLRPAKAIASKQQISLSDETPFARELERSNRASRSELATRVLQEHAASVGDFIASPMQQKLLALANEIRGRNGSLGELLRVIQSSERIAEYEGAINELVSRRPELSDTLLACT